MNLLSAATSHYITSNREKRILGQNHQHYMRVPDQGETNLLTYEVLGGSSYPMDGLGRGAVQK